MIELNIPNDLNLKVYIDQMPDLSNLGETEYKNLVNTISDMLFESYKKKVDRRLKKYWKKTIKKRLTKKSKRYKIFLSGT